MDITLEFAENQRLKADGEEYCVIGGIEFSNSYDGSKWVEYLLKPAPSGQTRWLSIDNLYEEYAIYTQYSYSSAFREEEIGRAGFREADSGTARVVRCFGQVDVCPGDTVKYTEYEDGTEEQLISIEVWDEETEYSKGWYLDREEITPLDGGKEPGSSGISLKTGRPKRFAYLWILGALAVLGFGSYLLFQKQDKSIGRFLSQNSYFTYETSITSNLNSRQKADVYRTSLPIESAAKEIIKAIDGKTEAVQEGEDQSVAILTRKEYCLIYEGTEGEVLVQISLRAYTYQSTNSLYHSNPLTHAYYRRFYYSRGFFQDYSRNKNKSNGYENYNEGILDINSNDPYKSYSDSIRQSSIKSRSSSGGGISSGK